jgi:hypothetical protein
MKKRAGKKPEKTEHKIEIKKPEEMCDKVNCKGYIGKLKKLFFKPSAFLDSTEKEKEYQPILAFFVVLSVAYFIVSALIGVVFKDASINYLDYLKTSLLGFVWIVIYSVIYSVIQPFIFGGIIHIGVLIFRGKEKYFETFKVLTYALVIGILYSFILLILASIIKIVLPFNAAMLTQIATVEDPELMMSLYSQFFAQPGALLSIIVSVIIMIASMIHQLIFLIKGISKYQQLSRMKAAGAVILPVLVVLIIAILVAIVVALIMNSAAV